MPTASARPRRTLRRLAPGALCAVLGLGLGPVALAGCSGGSSGGDDRPPEDVLAAAQQTLDETSGVQIHLSTDDLPSGVTGVEGAEGIGTHDPAFDGSIDVVLSGQSFQVPVVAVDDKVYVQLPLTPGWQDVDPADYGAPDPARLMDPDQGLSSLLPATTDLARGDSVRGGSDNSEVLTEYTGTVPGDVVARVIPSASGDFEATYTVADGDQLRSAELTGAFYPDADDLTYTVDFEDYGVEKEITAP